MVDRRDLLKSLFAAASSIRAAASRQPVLLDQDGGMPDDYLSTALLLTMDRVQTLGVVVTPADCYIEPAVSATRKIIDLIGRPEVRVAASTVHGVHPFPDVWRKSCRTMDQMRMLNGRGPLRTPLAAESGTQFMVQTLEKATEPVTLLVTGPLSTVADALAAAPRVEAKIRRIVWMGGALNVPGNVEPKIEPKHDGSAEWNVYWDAPAAARVWSTKIPIVLCPLDITNHVPVTQQLVDRLRSQSRHPLSQLAAEAYGKAISPDMFFWDILTTSYIGRPELFQLREWETVIVTEGPSEGRTKAQKGGRKIQALDKVDLDGFYRYLLRQWAR